MTDHERAARIRQRRRRAEHHAAAALTTIRSSDPAAASQIEGFIGILTAEANAYALAARTPNVRANNTRTEHGEGEDPNTAAETSSPSRAGLPDAAPVAAAGAIGLSNTRPTHPILPRNSGEES